MLTTLLSTIAVIFLVTILHYEVLTYLSTRHFQRARPFRLLLPIGVLVIIFTHIVGVWAFGITYYLLFLFGDVGNILGNFEGGILDCVYFSFVNYTTLGYGDQIPEGHIRFLAGTESLVGLVLVAWSASFTYLEMQRTTEKTKIN